MKTLLAVTVVLACAMGAEAEDGNPFAALGKGGGGGALQQLLCLLKPGPGCPGQDEMESVELEPTCRQQVAASEQCIFDEIINKVKPSPEEAAAAAAAKERVKAEVTRCFVSRGCRDPVALKKGLKTCMRRSVIKCVAEPFQQCVTAEGYDPPAFLRQAMEEEKDGGAFAGLGGKGRGGGMERHLEKLRAKLPIVCDEEEVSSEEAEAAFDCAVAAVRGADERRPRRRGMNPIKMIGSIMSALARCQRHVGEDEDGNDCGDYAVGRKDAMCGCLNDMDEAEVKACLSGDWERCKASLDVEGQILSPKERRELEQKLGRAKAMIKRLCSMRF